MLALRIIVGFVCGEALLAILMGMATDPRNAKEWAESWLGANLILLVIVTFMGVLYGIGFAVSGDPGFVSK